MASLGELVATMSLNIGQFTGALNKAEQEAVNTTRAIKKGFASINSSLAELAAGFLSVHAVLETFNKAVERGSELKELSGAFDIAVGSLDELSLAMSLAGTDMATLEKQFKTLGNVVTQATNPASKAAATFKAMGVEIKDASGNMLGMDEIYKNAIRQLSAIEDPTLRASAAMELFGKGATAAMKAAAELDESLEQAEAQVKAYGSTSEETAKLSKQFKDGLLLLADGAQRMMLPVIKALLPVFENLREAFAKSSEGSVDLAAALGGGLAVVFEKLGVGAIMIVGTLKGLGLVLGGLAAAATALVTDGFKAAGVVITAMNEDLEKNKDATIDSMEAIQGHTKAMAYWHVSTARAAVDADGLRKSLNGAKDAGKEATDAFNALMGGMARGIDKIAEAGNAWAEITAQQSKIEEEINKRRGTTKAFTDAQVDALRAEAKAFDEATRAGKVYAETLHEMNTEAAKELSQGARITAALDASKKSADEFVAATQDQINASNLLANAMGLTANQQAIIAANNRIDIELRKQLAKLDEEEAKLSKDTSAANYQATIDAIEADKARARSAADAARTIVTANLAAQESFAAGWTRAWEAYRDGINGARIAQEAFNALTQSMEQLFINFANHAKNAWQTFKDSALAAINQIAAKLAVSGILGLFSGGATALDIGSLTGNLAGGAGGLGGLVGSLQSMIGIGTGDAGSLSGTLLGSMGAGGMGPPTAGLLGAAMTAVPWAAVALAVTPIIASLFKSGGGPKSGGFAQTGTEAGRYYTPNQVDATLQTLVDTQAQGFDQLVKALGGTSRANFALGYDTDPNGTAGNRVTGGVYVGGRNVYSALNVGAGKDDASLQAELQVQAKRMLLAALQASDLPVQIAKLIGSVSATAASAQQIDDILAAAQAVGQLSAALALLDDPLTAAADSLEAANMTALDAWEKQRDALRDLATAAPDTAEGLASVTTATQGFAQATVALLAGIMNAKKALDDMFESTRSKISAVGKSPDQLYAEEQARAERLFQQLQGATDPEQINNLARQINDSINNAFSMLSPEQQQAAQQDFLTGLDRVQQTTDARLQAAIDRVAEQSKTDQEFLSSKLDQILSGLSGAVSDFSGAVNTFAGASGRNSVVVSGPPDLRGARQTNFA